MPRQEGRHVLRIAILRLDYPQVSVSVVACPDGCSESLVAVAKTPSTAHSARRHPKTWLPAQTLRTPCDDLTLYGYSTCRTMLVDQASMRLRANR